MGRVVCSSFVEEQTPDLGMDSWKSRSRLHVWRNRKVILHCRKIFSIKAVQILCSPVLFFSTVTGLSGLWTCCAAIQNELCFRLSLVWVQLCPNWGISGLEKVHFLLHITKIKLASPNELPRPCGSRSGIWGTWCRNWNHLGIWCTNHEGNLPAISCSPVVITSSGFSRSKLTPLGFDTIPAHCSGFKKYIRRCLCLCRFSAVSNLTRSVHRQSDSAGAVSNPG